MSLGFKSARTDDASFSNLRAQPFDLTTFKNNCEEFLDPRLATLYPRPFTLDPRLVTLDPRLVTLDPRPFTLDPQLATLDP